ncbi:DNA topoisomerase IB [Nocardia rhamnosiphila]|uniref:DNA topoisomerase IB n=1 Tax=Nocardia rhamnosiphila TaxID=426716 RepID=UPI000A5AF5C8|nr:DNA topoisomerase IB [Nocardia rhamnosiphila]
MDAAGRRQYLYHERWRRDRDEEKFDRVLELAARLPELRRRLHADLDTSGLGKHRVEALAIAFVDRGVSRSGGEEYAEENGTCGIATLLRKQVRISGDTMQFDYVAKGGKQRRVQVSDRPLTRACRALRRCRADSERLLLYREGAGNRELRAEDVNARFKGVTAPDYTAKDLRTWQATVLAAAGFGATERPASTRGRKLARQEVFAQVAEALGNTPAVARESYVDPRVVEAFEDGSTIAALRRANRLDDDRDRTEIIERAALRLLRKQAG